MFPRWLTSFYPLTTCTVKTTLRELITSKEFFTIVEPLLTSPHLKQRTGIPLLGGVKAILEPVSGQLSDCCCGTTDKRLLSLGLASSKMPSYQRKAKQHERDSS